MYINVLKICIYFYFPYCFLFVTYSTKFFVCFFVPFTQSLVFIPKPLQFLCLFLYLAFGFSLFFRSFGNDFGGR